MVSLTGSPDFQIQPGGPVTLLTSQAVSITGSGSITLTDIAQPNHTAIIVVWDNTNFGSSNPIIVGAATIGGFFVMANSTLLQDNSQVMFPFPGAMIVNSFNNVWGLNLIQPPGTPTPLTGNINVFGVTGLGIVIPQVRQQFIGKGASTSVNSSGGVAGNLLPAPPAGTYYRIKTLGILGPAAAPAAGASMAIAALSSGQTFLNVRTDATGFFAKYQSYDTEWEDGLVFTCNSASVHTSYCIYETWPS